VVIGRAGKNKIWWMDPPLLSFFLVARKRELCRE